MANTKVTIVLNGYLSLDPAERREFIKELNAYIEAKVDRKRSLQEDIEKRASMSLGPLESSRCPCCHR